MTEARPYGSWPSPITAARLVAGAAAPGEVRVDGDDIWWSESRPAEGGRTQLVRRVHDGRHGDVLPSGDTPDATPWNARTSIHEYGGGAWCVGAGVVTFAQFSDQRLYRYVADDPDTPPRALTPVPSEPRSVRFGDLVAWDTNWVLAVREELVGGGPDATHDIVAIPTDASAVDDPARIRVLVSGPDFVSSPRPGPAQLAWTQWDHPRMPWDGTELAVARLGRDADGAPELRSDPVVVAGGPDESVVQPEWDRSGALWFCSDGTGWWNLHRVGDPQAADAVAAVEAVAPVEAEIGGPQWVFGGRWFAPLPDGSVIASITAAGMTGLAHVSPGGALDRLDTDLTAVAQVVAGPGRGQAVVVAASATTEVNVSLVHLGAEATVEPVRPARDLGFGAEVVSAPEAIEFPSADGRTAHALLYRPRHEGLVGPDGERPPLVVFSHGGPTSAARSMLDLSRQFWTSRGIAVVDVNYGGSTGYGRPYRRLLDGRWGIVDVEDCVAAARHLADEGVVDARRIAIRGGSAGGFTTLAALCSSDIFAAGTSLYGVADLEALARDTHDFESRYLDGLVGPYPADRATYIARSPIHHTEDFSCPLLVLQGAEDRVVPPAQAEAIVAAVAAKGLPHASITFAGEGHGFRRSDSIIAALEAELWFYGRVLGFTPADELTPVAGAVGL